MTRPARVVAAALGAGALAVGIAIAVSKMSEPEVPPEPSTDEVLEWARRFYAAHADSSMTFEESFTDGIRAELASGRLHIGGSGRFRLVYEAPSPRSVCGDGLRVRHEVPERAVYYHRSRWLAGFELLTGGRALVRYEVDPARPSDGEAVCLRSSPADHADGELRVCVSAAAIDRGAVRSLQYRRSGGRETMFRFGSPQAEPASREELCPDPPAWWTPI